MHSSNTPTVTDRTHQTTVAATSFTWESHVSGRHVGRCKAEILRCILLSKEAATHQGESLGAVLKQHGGGKVGGEKRRRQERQGSSLKRRSLVELMTTGPSRGYTFGVEEYTQPSRFALLRFGDLPPLCLPHCEERPLVMSPSRRTVQRVHRRTTLIARERQVRGYGDETVWPLFATNPGAGEFSEPNSLLRCRKTCDCSQVVSRGSAQAAASHRCRA